MAGKTIVVFGGTGFLGARIARAVAERGISVRVAARHPPHDGPKFEFVRADVLDPQSSQRAVAGAHGVVNAVSLYVERGPATFHTIHVTGAAALARAAHNAGVVRFVQISGLGADPNSRSPYIRARALGEEAVRDAFATATIVRPSVLFGPDDAFVVPLANLLRLFPVFPLFGAGQTRLQPVHADDVAEAVARILERDDAVRTYQLGGPEVARYEAILRVILRHMRRRRVLVPFPFFAWRIMGYLAEYLPSPPVTRNQIELMEIDNVAAPSAPGFGDLGITPRSLGESLPSILDRR